mgnify:CR=1 FL=1
MASLFICLLLLVAVWYASLQQNVEQERDNVTEFMNWIKDRGIDYMIRLDLATVAPVEIVEYARMGRGENEEQK